MWKGPDSSGVTFRKPTRKPTEEEETKMSKSVTPEQAPTNFEEEEISRSDSGVIPEQAPPNARKNFGKNFKAKL